MKTPPLLLTVFVLAGCVTGGDPKPASPLSQVTIYREPSSRDSLFPMLFTVDGRPVMQLQPDEEQSFELPAGDYSFGYKLGLYDCATRVRIESGKAYGFRLARGCIIEPESD